MSSCYDTIFMGVSDGVNEMKGLARSTCDEGMVVGIVHRIWWWLRSLLSFLFSFSFPFLTLDLTSQGPVTRSQAAAEVGVQPHRWVLDPAKCRVAMRLRGGEPSQKNEFIIIIIHKTKNINKQSIIYQTPIRSR
jgi:hypothetical protein